MTTASYDIPLDDPGLEVEVDWNRDGDWNHARSDMDAYWSRGEFQFGSSRRSNPQRPQIAAGAGRLVVAGDDFVPGRSQVFTGAQLQQPHRCRVTIDCDLDNPGTMEERLFEAWLEAPQHRGSQGTGGLLSTFGLEGYLERPGREQQQITQTSVTGATTTTTAVLDLLRNAYDLDAADFAADVDSTPLSIYSFDGTAARYAALFAQAAGGLPCARRAGGLRLQDPSNRPATIPVFRNSDYVITKATTEFDIEQLWNDALLEYLPTTRETLTGRTTLDYRHSPRSSDTITFNLPDGVPSDDALANITASIQPISARVYGDDGAFYNASIQVSIGAPQVTRSGSRATVTWSVGSFTAVYYPSGSGARRTTTRWDNASSRRVNSLTSITFAVTLGVTVQREALSLVAYNADSIEKWRQRVLTLPDPPWFAPTAQTAIQARIDDLAEPRNIVTVEFALRQSTAQRTRDVARIQPGDHIGVVIDEPAEKLGINTAVMVMNVAYRLSRNRLSTKRLICIEAGAVAVTVTVPGAPDAPTLVAGDGQLAVSWSRPSDTGGGSITHYDLRYRTGSGQWTEISDISGTNRTITGLTNGDTYEVQVRAANSAGDGAWSASETATPTAPVVTEPPGTPISLAATAGDGEVVVTWAAGPGGTPTSYRVWYKTGSTDSVSGATEVTPRPTGTTVTITGLTNDTQIQVWVAAVNADGQSAVAGPANATPTAGDLMPGFGGATIANQSWPARVDIGELALPAATGGDGTLTYDLQPALPDGLTLGQAQGGGAAILGTPTTEAAAVTYTWTAEDEDGDTASLMFTITITAAPRVTPSAVRNIVATAGDAQFSVAFDEPAQGSPTRYRLRYRPRSSSAAHTTGTHSGSPITITGLTNGTEYEFQLRAEDISATDGNLVGPWSANVYVTPSAALPGAAAPSVTIDPIAQGVAGSTVGLSATISGGTYDTISYTWAVTGGDASLSGETTATPTLTRRSTAGAMTVSLLVEVDGTGTVARNGTTDNAQDAENAVATAPVVLPDADAPTVVIAAIPVGIVGTDIDLSATISGGTYDALDYAWSVTGGDASLSGATTATPMLTRRSTAGAMTISLTVTARGTGTVAASGTSDTASDAENATARARVVPGVPSSLAAVAGDARIVVTWAAPATGDPATEYTVEWTAGGVGLTATVTALTHTLTGLTNDTEYSIRVRASNAAGNGGWTTAVTATPAALVLAGPPMRLVRILNNNRTANVAVAVWTAPDGYTAALTARAEVQHRTGSTTTWTSAGAQGDTFAEIEAGFWMVFSSAAYPKYLRARVELQPDGTSDAASRVWTEWQETEFASRPSSAEEDPIWVPLALDGLPLMLDAGILATEED